jgi:hypothetical protein
VDSLLELNRRQLEGLGEKRRVVEQFKAELSVGKLEVEQKN